MEVFSTLLGQKPQILFDIVTYFLADAVAEYKKLGSLEQQKGLNTQLRSLEVQSAGRQGRAALSAVRRPSSPLPRWPPLLADLGPKPHHARLHLRHRTVCPLCGLRRPSTLPQDDLILTNYTCNSPGSKYSQILRCGGPSGKDHKAG